MRQRVVLAVVGVVVVGCGQPGSDVAESNAPAGSATSADRSRFSGSVLESADHGPQLCVTMLQSNPPQCGGPDVRGWAWDDVEAESADGTTWGSYDLIGTWDGDAFTLAAAPRPVTEPLSGTSPASDFLTPCPEPVDGWPPPGPATREALEQAISAAAEVPGHAGVWVDEHPSDDGPGRLVLNVLTGGDSAEMEAVVRQVWPGALCVTPVDRTEAELVKIQRTIVDEVEGTVGVGVDTVANLVHVQMWLVTPEIRAELEARFGADAVRLTSILEPLE